MTVEGDRWYGRGTADNKGQHTVNLVALERVLHVRGGRLGFNVKVLIEMGEEVGSPGLNALCAAHAGDLTADLLIASDGPRLVAERPTLFLGSHGAYNFELVVDLREGAHHSGNWGACSGTPERCSPMPSRRWSMRAPAAEAARAAIMAVPLQSAAHRKLCYANLFAPQIILTTFVVTAFAKKKKSRSSDC